jgi:Holliday junction resolvase|tara:strand:- start:366 stop:743 length:378 start_codon:yes stop_codon:yes gene_type:complete
MSGRSPKRKGDGYERELAKYFNEKVFDGDDKVQRAPLSGGGAVKSSGGSDLKNTPHIYVEAKRTEKFQIHQSMRQVEENLEISKSKDIPVVITRRNRTETGDSLCVLKLDDFLKIYKLLINESSD